MAVALVVVVTGALVGLAELPVHEGLGDLVGVTGVTGVDGDAVAVEHVPGSVPDASADESLDTQLGEEGGEASVGVLSRTNYLRLDVGSVHGEYLELTGLSEMLEDLSVCVSDCEFHATAIGRPVFN